VAEALAYAHAQKVLHRDIKPANLLLDLQGIIWVTDFGLAKEEGDDLTQTGDLVGTLRYMAPERFGGLSDARSDVYSLGLTLYELVTLRPAFDETDRGRLINRISHEEPPRPRKLDAQLPRDLETIILKATAKEARLRYQSAEEMCEDLRRFLADRPIRARRSAVWEHAWRWCRRNPVIAGLSALAGVLLLIVAIGVPLAALLRNERDRALNAEAEARSAEKRALQAEGEGAFRSHLAQAAAYRHAGQVGQSFKSMVEVKQALALARTLNLGPKAMLEVRNEAIACLVLPDLEVFKEWDCPGTTTFAIDPAFQVCAYSDLDGAVTVRRLRDDQVLQQLPAEGPVEGYLGLEFSPDGRLLHRMCLNKHSTLFRLDGAQVVPLVPNHYHLAFRPDGRQFAAGYGDGSVLLYDSDSGKELRRFATGLQGRLHLRWNPQLPALALLSANEIRLLDLETGTVCRLPAPAKVNWVDWHPHGRVLAVSGSDAKIYLCDTVTNQLVMAPLVGPRTGGVVVAFNHAGDRLLSTEWYGHWRLWDMQCGQQIMSMWGGGDTTVQFSADDRLVAVGWTPPKIRLFRLRPGRELRTLMRGDVPTAGDAIGYFFGWHARRAIDETGRVFAVPTADNKLALLDLQRGEVLATLPGWRAAFAADGSLWTSGPRGPSYGVHRWPVRLDAATGRMRVGPPEHVYPANDFARDPAGKVLAFADFDRGALVIHTETLRTRRLGPQGDVRHCAVSSDEHWVATGSHWLRHGTAAKVWDISTRPPRHVKDLPVGGLCAVSFSPDRQWLFTGGGGPRLWKVGTWEEGPPLGGTTHNAAFAFSADGKLLALGHEPGVVRLVRPHTGEEVARLTAPVKSPLLPQAFTKNSAELITVGSETGALHIFDLRAIRAQLAELDLDWDPASIPAPPEAHAGPLQIEVDAADLSMTDADKRTYWQRNLAVSTIRLAANPYDARAALLRGRAYSGQGDKPRAVDEYARALALIGPHKQGFFTDVPAAQVARELNDWAWQWTAKPATDTAAPEAHKARLLAENAVTLAPEQWLYRNTLGVVCYRLGNYQEACKHLQRSLDGSKGDTAAFDLYFLAMCHQRLGDPARARECYDQAVRWVEAEKADLPQGWIDELKTFRAEAATVLGLANP
jgi:WD40 repeat protein/tetratricopeptide (TPR) repeat protein